MSKLIVGTSVFVIRGESVVRGGTGYQFLIGLRTSEARRGADCWTLPGGICEDNETIEQCAVREVLEETGLMISVRTPNFFNPTVLPGIPDQIPCLAATDYRPRAPHISFWMVAQPLGKEEPKVMEPDKCLAWHWVTPAWIFDHVANYDDGEQAYWTPMYLWAMILPPLGFEPF